MKKYIAGLVLMYCCLWIGSVSGWAEENQNGLLTSGDYTYRILEDGTACITDYDGEETQIILPGTIDGITVSSIGEDAFWSSNNCSYMEIPDSITNVAEGAFNVNTGIEMDVSPDNPGLAVIDHVLFSKADRKLLYYPDQLMGRFYQIPDGIEVIGKSAFHGCENLMELIMPDSVTAINESAFDSSVNLAHVNMSDHLISIGDMAFMGCAALTDLTLPESLQEIGVEAFCACIALKELTIPDRVTVIGDGAFMDCFNLMVHVSPDHPAFSVIDQVLFCKTNHELLFYPVCKEADSYSVPDGTEIIGMGAFAGCEKLESLTLPEGIREIGEQCFAGCEQLTVTVEHDSYAQEYCRDNGVDYIYPDSYDWLRSGKDTE